MICCIFLLASWAFLPLEKTRRHYLSVSLTCAVVLMNVSGLWYAGGVALTSPQLGFIISLAGQPQECFNKITPNGMESSTKCALSGAFLLGGGWAGVMWVFLRALSLHLQLCWQTAVGHNFVWCFQVLGWGVPMIGLVLALTLSGVSFRFGQTCHINHTNIMAAFWIPLLIVAGIAFMIHLTTLSYCIKVYLTFFAEDSTDVEGPDMSLHLATAPTKSPRQAYQRVRRVIQLQWRGMVIVVVILCDVIFFAVVFVFQESTAERVQSGSLNSLAWAACLVENLGDKTQCFDQTHTLIVNMPTSVAVLILLAVSSPIAWHPRKRRRISHDGR